MIPLICADQSMAKAVILNCGAFACLPSRNSPTLCQRIYFIVISQLYLVILCRIYFIQC